MSINPARGEVALTIGGRAHSLCLTLGALAEIEAIEADTSLTRGGRLVAILRALLRGGGHELTNDELSELDPDLACKAIQKTLAGPS